MKNWGSFEWDEIFFNSAPLLEIYAQLVTLVNLDSSKIKSKMMKLSLTLLD